ITLNPARIEIIIQPGNKKYSIDIGGYDLLGCASPRRFAGKFALSRQYPMDSCLLFLRARPRDHPITHGRKILSIAGLIAKLTRNLRRQFPQLAIESIALSLFQSYTSGDISSRAIIFKVIFKKRIPA